MLDIMRRGSSKKETVDLVKRLKSEIPNIAIRTTFLVGHPCETEEDFNELVEFVKEFRFDRVGVFTYSEEEGTHSAKTYPDDISDEVKNNRLDVIMELQREISLKNNQSRVGQTYKVIVDRFEDQYIIGRTEYDSPEVDQEVIIKKDSSHDIKQGDFINVRITSCDDYDLIGEIE